MSPQLQKEELSAILHICCKPLGLLWYLGTTKFHLNDSEVITTDLDTKGTWLKWTLASKVSGTYLTLGPKCSLNEKEVWEPKSFSMFENFRMRSEKKKKAVFFYQNCFPHDGSGKRDILRSTAGNLSMWACFSDSCPKNNQKMLAGFVYICIGDLKSQEIWSWSKTLGVKKMTPDETHLNNLQ